MKPRRVCALFFSPTGGTRRAALLLAEELAAQFGVGWEEFRFTTPKERDATLRFGQEDLVVAASPVYAGRLPNKLAPEFAEKLCGTHTSVVPLCVFGNRSPGDALREWLLLLEKGGFVPVGAASVACRHAFSDRIGAGRPDETDREAMRTFSRSVAEKLEQPALQPLRFDRETPFAPYYTPLKTDGTPAKFLKAKPVRLENCNSCGRCAEVCPMGSIDPETLQVNGVCIKCQACIRFCPMQARALEDSDFLSHVAMLEEHYAARAENTFLL